LVTPPPLAQRIALGLMHATQVACHPIPPARLGLRREGRRVSHARLQGGRLGPAH